MKRNCLSCGKEFKTYKCHIDKGYGKYCSSRCAALGRWKNPTQDMLKHLKEAQVSARVSRIGAIHSKDTKDKISTSRRGKCLRESNPRWNGGIGIYRNAIDVDVCSMCGSKDGLVVHHKDRDRHNNNVENLMVLCTKCHCKVHNHFNRWGENNASWNFKYTI